VRPVAANYDARKIRGLGRVRGADGAGSPPATRPGKRFSSQVSTHVPAIGPAQTFLNVVFSVGWNKRLLFIRRPDDNAAGDVQRRHSGSRAMPLTRLRGSQAGLVLVDAVARRTKAAETCGMLDGVAAIGSSPRVATHRARTPTLDNGASHAPIAATRIGGRSRPSCAVDHRGGRAAKRPWSRACAQPSRLDAPCTLADVPRAIRRVRVGADIVQSRTACRRTAACGSDWSAGSYFFNSAKRSSNQTTSLGSTASLGASWRNR
jgi:hypothetical protein